MAILGLGLLGSPACAAGGLSPAPPSGVSPNGQRIRELYDLISIPAIVIFVVVEGLIGYIVLRFRRSKQKPGYLPPRWHGNTRLEVAWFVLPTIIVALIGYLSFAELVRDFGAEGGIVAPAEGPTDLDLTVTAYQFGWDYEYPQGFTLHEVGNADGNVEPVMVPVGKLVRMRVRTRDVIHSWWVPDLTGKTDAVPGYDNFMWFRIDRPGEWRGQCAELCGVGHSTMFIRVKAVSQADFDRWVSEKLRQKEAPASSSARQVGPSPAATGEYANLR